MGWLEHDCHFDIFKRDNDVPEKDLLISIIDRAIRDLVYDGSLGDNAYDFFQPIHGDNKDEWHPIYYWCCENLEADPVSTADGAYASGALLREAMVLKYGKPQYRTLPKKER